ncbi:hypothetical protein ACE193_06740 [Bernardetia sp. OM2101]|uniref:hypothetical protein n=1 Tax=Bernardetia sp. OM2101 TaxID=3344876 RepID=UPI0035D04B43
MKTFQNTKKEQPKTEKIAILSVLKPVNDIRAYHKIAKSISYNSENSKKVTLIGFEASSNSEKENTNLNINFIELFTSKKHKNRLGFWRFFAGFKVFNQLLKLKPNTIIVCAVEILPFTLFFKFLFSLKSESKSNSIKLVYDVQENYSFNILYQDNYPLFLKKSLAFLIQFFEKLSSFFIDLYLLAERCYLEEMPYLKNKNYVFLENKFLIENNENLNTFDSYHSDYLATKKIKFLLYGSFSKTYGTLEGILFFKKLEKELQKNGFSATLILAGYCSDSVYSQKINTLIENETSILLINDSISSPVSHTILLQQLQKTGFVILPYLFNKSTQNCIPTKFYECLGYQKPMLISENPNWKNFIQPLEAGIFIDFENEKLEDEIPIIIQKILSQKFYTKAIDEKIWKFDREVLKRII